MMKPNKIGSLKTNDSNREKPCELAAAFLKHEMDGGTIHSFLSQFDFDSREEIAVAVRNLCYCIAGDKYMSDKVTQESNVYAKSIYRRFNSICISADKFDKYPVAIGGELWHGGYSRRKMEANKKQLFESTIVSHADWAMAANKISSLYGLSASDMDKLQFFIEQVKAGDDFPNSLRRMLYIWGATKMTGKTTTATMIVCILNGESDYRNATQYSTDLKNEMQIGSFAVPKISEYDVCMMDECFYYDMSKTYADFKRFMTSSGGRARLPFGQEFQWYGRPNYVATSNDPLKRFIKDWDDRRYLSVEFKNQPAERLKEQEIYDLWRIFIVGSKRTMDWADWAEQISSHSNEIGERTERSTEFELELCRSTFLDYLLAQQSVSDKPSCGDNRISLKFFVDYFAAGGHAADASKRRDEIEQAVLNVFGDRYSTQTFWLLSDLQEVARELKHNIITSDDAIFDYEDDCELRL